MQALLLTLSFTLLSAVAHAAGCEVAASPKERMNVTIAGYGFDPLLDPAPVPAELRANESTTGRHWWLVQLKKSPTREEHRRLASIYGLALARATQGNAYIESVDAQNVAKLKCEPSVRSISLLHPGFKIAPPLQKKRSTLRAQNVIVSLHDPSTVEAAASRIRALGVGEVTINGDRITLRISEPDRIVDVARLEDVRWIEPQPVRDEDR
ncbi:MAG: hypothetical protein ABW171_05545 [Steroidobacter sp.]